MNKNATSVPSLQHNVKPLGQILKEAGLLSDSQIEVALIDQKVYSQLLIGEIFALHGWVKQKTSDFFVNRWQKIIANNKREKLGYYLKEAGLLNQNQIETILKDQKENWIRFGALAVIRGYLSKQTVNFFLEHLFPEQIVESAFRTSPSTVASLYHSQKETSLTNIVERGYLRPKIDLEVNQEEVDQQDSIAKYIDNDGRIWIA